MPNLLKLLSKLSILALIGYLAGCSETQTPGESIPVHNNAQEVETFYRDNPDRFVFATLQELPANLDWQDGSDLETFGDPRAKRGGRLTLHLNNMQQTLRIVGPDANGTLRGPLWSANMVNLIERHPWDDAYIPGLARQWAIDPEDNRVVYLKLDPDARWSDGKPFTADDLFFSLYFLLSEHIQDPAINRVYDEGTTRLTRYDVHTVAITSTKTSPDPLFRLTTQILLQKDFYSEFGDDYVDRFHWRFAPVTGAYVLDESKVKRGRQITFDRLEHWWADDKPFYRHRFNPDELTYVVIRDDPKAFEAFLRGDIDWHFLNQTERWYESKDSDPARQGYIERATVYHQLPAARSGVYINALSPLLDNQTVRAGIQHAINYEKVNEGFYRGDRRRIRSFADGYADYSHPTLQARLFDPQLAADYFAQAGFTTRGGDGILVNAAGQKLSFPLSVSTRGDDVTVASILKEEALAAGLELSLDVLDNTAFFTKTFEKNHQLAIHGWNTGYSPEPSFEWELRGADAGKPSNFNTTNIKDDRLDAFLVEWDQLTDPIRAQQVSHKVQERVHEFAAWVPGLTVDYSRLGYWRWVKWPEYFQVPRYFFFMSSGVFWIDEDTKKQTQDAQNQGKAFPATTPVFDRWKRE